MPATRLSAILRVGAALALASVQPAIGLPAAAQQAVQDNDFDIPAQPLDTALAAYFRSTGVQLLYDSALTTGRTSTAVHGRFAPREALRRLLLGTGLVVRYSRSNAAILVAAVPAGATSLVPLGRVVVRERIATRGLSMVERLAYYDRLGAELADALRTDARTARLSFRARVAVLVDEHGRIGDVRIDDGSGTRATDRLLVAVLLGHAVSPPPAGLQQPLAIVVTSKHPS